MKAKSERRQNPPMTRKSCCTRLARRKAIALPRQAVEKYVQPALKLGALEAKPISTQSIVTGRWVRLKCQFGCGGFAQCLTCPPFSPEPEQTAAMLKEYRTALLIHGDDHTDVTRIAVKLEREAFLDGCYKALALGSGPCRLCERCAIQSNKRECRHPEKARPSMEACGIDVYQTARNNGCPIEVVRDHRCPQNYYGLVLLE